MFSGAPKEALKTALSDMDYLRSKVVTSSEMDEDAEDDDTKETADEDEEGGGDEDEGAEDRARHDSAYESGEIDSEKKDKRPQVGVILIVPPIQTRKSK